MPKKYPGTRITWKNGAYRYRPRDSEKEKYNGLSWVRIGETEASVDAWLAGNQVTIKIIRTLDDAFNKYQHEVIPLKGFKSRENNKNSLGRLRPALGHLKPQALQLPQVMQYRDLIGKNFGKGAANSDIEVLSHCCSMLIMWGALKNWEHPIRGNRVKFPSIPRDKYVTHSEALKAWYTGDDFWKWWIAFKLKSSLDQKTMASITLADINEDGIEYKREKLNRYDTSRKPKLKLLVWDEELRWIVEKMLALRPRRPEDGHLFCNRMGGPYIDKDGTASPIKKRFQRLKKKAKLDYTEHDLRAKSTSDEELESMAARRADHGEGITGRVYRRKAEPMIPLSLREIGLHEMIQSRLS